MAPFHWRGHIYSSTRFFSLVLEYQSFYISDYIDSLPLSNTPEVFGLHPNAEIGYYTNAAKELWSHLIELQPQTGRKEIFGYLDEFHF